MAVAERVFSSPRVPLIGRHGGAAGAATSFMALGDVTSPAPSGDLTVAQSLRFPGGKAMNMRARAYSNNLATDLTVTLMKNGAAALNSAGTPLILTIVAGTTTPVQDVVNVTPYLDTDTFDVQLTSVAAGAGNLAQVGVTLLSTDN